MAISELGLKSIKNMISMFVWGNSIVDGCSSLNILTEPSVSMFQDFVMNIQNNSQDENFLEKIKELINEEVEYSKVYNNNDYRKNITELFRELMANNEEYVLLSLIIQSCDTFKTFDEKLLSLEEIKVMEPITQVSGYYNDNYFVLDITSDNFYLGYDNTACTDKEIANIYNYLIQNKELLKKYHIA